jgi:nucleotide-binding universal stress UspA family protein
MINSNRPNAPLQRILLAVDGSEHAYAAAKLLKDLPLQAGCEVQVVAVMLPRQAQNHAVLVAALEKTNEIVASEAKQVQTHLLTGYPAEQIVKFAEDWPPELILMGARGLRSTLGILLGGVAQQVVEYARWPVLVVRAPYTGLNRVLLVTDGSPGAEMAVDFLPRMTLAGTTDIRVMHILPPMPTPELLARSWAMDMQVGGILTDFQLEESYQRQMEQEEEDGKKLLDKTVEKLNKAAVEATPVLIRGDAASEIIAYAREHQVDLIVSASRGLGRVRGWLLGSVSRKLLHYATCSVLLVRQPEEVD